MVNKRLPELEVPDPEDSMPDYTHRYDSQEALDQWYADMDAWSAQTYATEQARRRAAERLYRQQRVGDIITDTADSTARQHTGLPGGARLQYTDGTVDPEDSAIYQNDDDIIQQRRRNKRAQGQGLHGSADSMEQAVEEARVPVERGSAITYQPNDRSNLGSEDIRELAALALAQAILAGAKGRAKGK